MGDYARELARFLAARGKDVCVLTEPATGPRPAGVRVVETRLRGWRDLPKVLRAVRREQPGVVQFEYSQYGWHRWGCGFWVNALVLLLRMRGFRVHVALHEFPIRYAQHPWQFAVAALQRMHFWLLCWTAHQVMSNTPERVEILRSWLRWRRHTCSYRPNSNCNPVAAFSEGERQALRRRTGVSEGATVVGVYGMFAEAKNIESVIEAALQVQREIPLHLWLLGDSSQAKPEYLARLRALAGQLERPAYWSGPLSPEDVSRHLQALDIFVLPQTDGHLTRSSSFMAAAAHGLPVVAVRNDRNQNGFTHGTHLWGIEEGRPTHVARAIRELSGAPELRARMGANLRQLYARAFDWQAVCGADIPQVSPSRKLENPNAGPSRAA